MLVFCGGYLWLGLFRSPSVCVPTPETVEVLLRCSCQHYSIHLSRSSGYRALCNRLHITIHKMLIIYEITHLIFFCFWFSWIFIWFFGMILNFLLFLLFVRLQFLLRLCYLNCCTFNTLTLNNTDLIKL